MNYSEMPLIDVVNIKTGKLNSNAAVENGDYPFFTCAPAPLRIDKFKYDQAAILLAGNNAEGNFHINYFEGKFEAYQRTYIIDSKDTDKYDLRYLFYALKECLHEFKLMSQGTSTKFLTMAILNGFKLNIPDINLQRKIVGVLWDLDQKIATNEAINRNLSEQANAYYEFWKQNLTGEAVELSSVIDVRDGTHASPKPQDEGYPLVTSKHLLEYDVDLDSPNKISQQDYDKINERSKVEFHDVLMSMIGTVGLVSFVSRKEINFAIKNVALFRTSQRDDLAYYFLLFLKSKETKQYIEACMAGSTQQYISLTELRKLPIIVPGDEISDFNVVVKPMIDTICSNVKENKRLSELRDLLLPKLMSGELDVSDLEI